MAKAEDASIDSILKSIREAIIEKEQRKNTEKKEPVFTVAEEQDEIFELTKTMMVKREDIPYQLGVWSFDDVAKKIMKKYCWFHICHPLLLCLLFNILIKCIKFKNKFKQLINILYIS